jgi:hypothetical protein
VAVLSGAVCLALCGIAFEVAAVDSRVDASFDGQFYDVTSPYGQPVIRRRRYTNTLGLDVSNLDDDHEVGDPDLAFRTRLRLDIDTGPSGPERSEESLARFAPGLEEAPLDLMYGYLEGRHYAGGLLGFRLGRQYQMDSLGWWSFDGALVRLDPPAYFGLEFYGGFEQRGGLPALATSRFEADGVMRGDRGDLADGEWPLYLQQTRLAPAYGVSLQSVGVSWLHTRLSYRKVFNRDRVVVTPFASSDDPLGRVGEVRVSTERAGYALALYDGDLGVLGASTVYDLYVERVSEYEAHADWRATRSTTLGAAYEYYLPTFDADSIFNWFPRSATRSATVHARSRLSSRFDYGLSFGARVYDAEDARARERFVDRLASANARYRLPQGSLAVDTHNQWGASGHRLGGDVTTRRYFSDGYYDSLLVLSLYDFSDALRKERDATSFTYVVGGGASPRVDDSLASRLGFEWEHSINRLIGHRFRLLVTVNFQVVP